MKYLFQKGPVQRQDQDVHVHGRRSQRSPDQRRRRKQAIQGHIQRARWSQLRRLRLVNPRMPWAMRFEVREAAGPFESENHVQRRRDRRRNIREFDSFRILDGNRYAFRITPGTRQTGGGFIGSMHEAVEEENKARSTAQGKIELKMELMGDRPSGGTPATAPLVQSVSAAIKAFGTEPQFQARAAPTRTSRSVWVFRRSRSCRWPRWPQPFARRVHRC